jgi:hypothetical protein
MWLQTLLKELNIPHPPAARLWCDNLGATYLSGNLVFHARMKHIKVDFHFVRERVAHKLREIQSISSKDQLPDGLAKALGVGLLLQFRNNLSMVKNIMIEGDDRIERLCRS